MVLETYMKLCLMKLNFLEFFFFFLLQKLGDGHQNWLQNNVFRIYLNYIICCVPAPIPDLGKSLFLRFGSKCAPPNRLQDFLINHISRTNLWNSLIFYFKSWSKNFEVGMVKKWAWSVWSQDSKIDCISRRIDGIDCFFFMLIQIQES